MAQFADLDNDGDLDFVAKVNRRSAKVFINDGKGQFSALQDNIYTSTDSPFVISDINGDKYPDIVARNAWLNDTNVAFSEANSIPMGANARFLISEDFDGDGDQDLFDGSGSQYGDHRLLLNNGYGQFTKSSQYFGKDAAALVAADINGDDRADLIIASDNQIHLYVNDGKGYFEEPTLIDDRKLFVRHLLAADIDGDGDSDLLNDQGRLITIYLNQPAL